MPESLAKLTDGQHVAVGIAAGRHMFLPQLTAVEHIFQQIKIVPEIIRDPPHIGVGLVVPGLVYDGRSGGQGQHDGTAAALNGSGQHTDFVLAGGLVIAADIVAFDEIYAPGGIQFQQGVIISLSRRGILHAVHVRVPGADGGGDGHIVRRYFRALYGAVVMGGDPGDAPHDMDAELQPQIMDMVGQRLETGSVHRGRKAGGIRQQTGVFVHGHFGEGYVLVFVPAASGADGVPLDIHHDVFPAMLFQMCGHVVGVGLHLFLVYGGVVVVVAVPAHGRGGGEVIFVFHNKPPWIDGVISL